VLTGDALPAVLGANLPRVRQIIHTCLAGHGHLI
jgi:hypothetical protein